jgi:hypothetical protein
MEASLSRQRGESCWPTSDDGWAVGQKQSRPGPRAARLGNLKRRFL